MKTDKIERLHEIREEMNALVEEASELDYFKEVAKTGNDYLNELIIFNPQKTKTHKERWQFRIVQSIGGLMIAGARRNAKGEWIAPHKLPQTILDYLCARKAKGAAQRFYCVCCEAKTIQELSATFKAQDSCVKIQKSYKNELKGVCSFSITSLCPVKVSEATKKAARRQINMAKGIK